MIEDDQDAFISKILARQIGHSVKWTAPETPPMLEERYLEEVQIARDFLETKIATQRAILQIQGPEELATEYDELGQTDDPASIANWRDVRSELQGLFKSSPVILAGLGHPNCWPDYAYWSRMEHFSIMEVVWLAIGLEPRFEWVRRAATTIRDDRYISPYLERADDLKEQIERFLRSSMMYHDAIKAGPLLEWITKTGFPVQDRFRETLATISERQSLGSLATSEVKPTDKRELAAVQKIIAAMAIDGYGYDPTAKRSPIPGQIETACDQAGIPVSRETVLKHLRAGLAQLPDD